MPDNSKWREDDSIGLEEKADGGYLLRIQLSQHMHDEREIVVTLPGDSPNLEEAIIAFINAADKFCY
jgi:hypothetical protein